MLEQGGSREEVTHSYSPASAGASQWLRHLEACEGARGCSAQESASQGPECGDTVSAQSLIQGTDMQTVTMQVASFVLTECREGTCQHRAVRVRGWVGGWEW